MLDKTSKEWKKTPIWVRSALCLVNTRQGALRQEALTAVLAALLLVFTASTFIGAIVLIVSFMSVGAMKWVDNTEQWEST